MADLAGPDEVRAILVGAAKARVALTYSQVLETLGYTFSRPKMRALCAVLGAVDEEARSRGEPELAVLVVRQSDGLPGQGWWVSGAARHQGYDGPWERPSARAFINKAHVALFEYWSEDRA